MPTPRQRLLDAVVDFALVHGLADHSLRSIAQHVGTSHRMLIHHFGTREGLLVAVIRAVEDRQRRLLLALLAQPPSADAGWHFWQHLCDPALQPQERLFFEVYGQALLGRDWAQPLLEGVVDDWVDPIEARLLEAGADPTTARADARLALAVSRGLLLDLLATGDRAGVDAAMARFLAWFAAAALPAVDPPQQPSSRE
ncbi:MAG: TetR/AcrR family transcriptional regulator [Chloroflexi bacterium]|nr:TetR/AcrR family transcriptional regulator [Chloroflexota bacterium]